MISYIPNNEELISDLMTCYACKFSREGSKAMIQWIYDIYPDEEVFQWDPVAIGCDWSEWESLEEWGESYFGGRQEMIDGVDCVSLAELDERIEDYIHYNGCLIHFEGGVLVSSF